MEKLKMENGFHGINDSFIHQASLFIKAYKWNKSLYLPLLCLVFFEGKCATFGTCLALIGTKNRLKSLEVTIIEAPKIRDLQPFSHFTKNY